VNKTAKQLAEVAEANVAKAVTKKSA
jgi:hypothetical protein